MYKSIHILFFGLLALTLQVWSQENPFEAAVQDAYTGRFRSAEVELRLMPEAGQWHGSLVFKGKTYTAAGAAKAGQLEGTFTEGDQSWPFTAQAEGDRLIFTAGSFTAALARQKLPKLEGTWGSPKVEMEFQSAAEPRTGLIRFNGKEFTFAATEKAGDLEGVFKRGEKAYPFTVANEPRGLSFQTGTFGERIKQMPKTFKNSLGMKFVSVPGTDVMFSVWDTRVQDYRAYAETNSGVNEEWKKPGFDQGDTHPVVNVSWSDAKAFCAWLSRKEGKTYRLPTDAEWSVAVGLREASAGSPQDKDAKVADVYPWGTTWPPPNQAGNYDDYSSTKIAGFSDGYPRTSPVGSFAANQFGLYDMGGNVWQWCEDWYNAEQKYRVLRGASWGISLRFSLLSSGRISVAPVCRDCDFGFRVVLVGGSAP